MKAKGQPNEWSFFIPAILLLMLWAYAAFSKIVDHEKFVAQIELAPVPLMHILGPALGWAVPAVELTLVLLLCFDRFRKWGLLMSCVLLLLFEIYIAAMLFSGLDLPCTCGGLISKLQWKEHLIFNAVFMAIAACPFIYNSNRKDNNSNGYSPRSIYN